ncbi:hypothetical protein Tco_0201576 [Tanacetum coccineum]
MDMLKLVVEVECFGKCVDEFDKVMCYWKSVQKLGINLKLLFLVESCRCFIIELQCESQVVIVLRLGMASAGWSEYSLVLLHITVIDCQTSGPFFNGSKDYSSCGLFYHNKVPFLLFHESYKCFQHRWFICQPARRSDL